MKKAAETVAMPLRTATGKPIPEDFVSQVEKVLSDAREGKVTSMAWVAIGPDFAKWDNAYMAGRSDRLNLLGQLVVMQQEIGKIERDSE